MSTSGWKTRNVCRVISLGLFTPNSDYIFLFLHCKSHFHNLYVSSLSSWLNFKWTVTVEIYFYTFHTKVRSFFFEWRDLVEVDTVRTSSRWFWTYQTKNILSCQVNSFLTHRISTKISSWTDTNNFSLLLVTAAYRVQETFEIYALQRNCSSLVCRSIASFSRNLSFAFTLCMFYIYLSILISLCMYK